MPYTLPVSKTSSCPLHPVLVHYPIAFWEGALLTDLMFLLTEKDFWLQFSHVLLQAGCVMGSFAVLIGFIDFFRIRQDDPGMRAAAWHLGLCLGSWLLFCLNMLVRISDLLPEKKIVFGLSLTIVGLLLLIPGNIFGRRLVYVHGIGRGPSS